MLEFSFCCPSDAAFGAAVVENRGRRRKKGALLDYIEIDRNLDIFKIFCTFVHLQLNMLIDSRMVKTGFSSNHSTVVFSDHLVIAKSK